MNSATQLIEETRELLAARPYTLSLPKIAEETKLSESWLSKFAAGKVENPTVQSLFTLREFLKNYKNG